MYKESSNKINEIPIFSFALATLTKDVWIYVRMNAILCHFPLCQQHWNTVETVKKNVPTRKKCSSTKREKWRSTQCIIKIKLNFQYWHEMLSQCYVTLNPPENSKLSSVWKSHQSILPYKPEEISIKNKKTVLFFSKILFESEG